MKASIKKRVAGDFSKLQLAMLFHKNMAFAFKPLNDMIENIVLKYSLGH